MLGTDTWRTGGKWHLLVLTMPGTSWAFFLAHTEGEVPRSSCAARGQAMDHSSEAGEVAERSCLCPASPSSLERNHLLRPPKNGLCKQGMPLLLEGTTRKGGESRLSVLTCLTPDKGIFHFCQATSMLHYQLPKEYTHKRVHGHLAQSTKSCWRGRAKGKSVWTFNKENKDLLV